MEMDSSIDWSIASNTNSMANDCSTSASTGSRFLVSDITDFPMFLDLFRFSRKINTTAISRTYGDTIDPRQKDQTHTALVALNDVWQLSSSQQLQFSGFFRTYNLSLFSDFGQGLIRQSEFRTVAGGSANYVNRFAEYFSLLAGFEYNREAPRRDDLDHYGFFNPANPSYYGPFTPVDGNNITIGSLTPYIAAEGASDTLLPLLSRLAP